MTGNVTWGYTETTLQRRIAIHDKYSKFEINDWIAQKIHMNPGERILDIGCGNGKQAIMYAKGVRTSGKVYGMDIAQDLLDEARKNSTAENLDITYINHNANDPFPFENDFFDAVSCCFSIYYYSDIGKTLNEMKRVLKNGGRIFIVGPTVDNAHQMLSVYAKVMGKHVSQVREERMRDEIVPLITKTFKDASVEIFENPIEFPDADTFLSYFSSTLILKESSENPEDMRLKLESIKGEIEKIIEAKGSFTVTKYVYGISGYK